MSRADGGVAVRVRHELSEGERVGRFVVLRDIEGRVHAVAAGSVGTVCETNDGTMMMLPAARLLHVPRPMAVVPAWLEGAG